MESLSVFLSRFGSQFKLPLPFVLGSLQARQHPFTESLSGLLRFFDPLGTGSLLGGVGGGLFLLSFLQHCSKLVVGHLILRFFDA